MSPIGTRGVGDVICELVSTTVYRLNWVKDGVTGVFKSTLKGSMYSVHRIKEKLRPLRLCLDQVQYTETTTGEILGVTYKIKENASATGVGDEIEPDFFEVIESELAHLETHGAETMPSPSVSPAQSPVSVADHPLFSPGRHRLTIQIPPIPDIPDIDFSSNDPYNPTLEPVSPNYNPYEPIGEPISLGPPYSPTSPAYDPINDPISQPPSPSPSPVQVYPVSIPNMLINVSQAHWDELNVGEHVCSICQEGFDGEVTELDCTHGKEGKHFFCHECANTWWFTCLSRLQVPNCACCRTATESSVTWVKPPKRDRDDDNDDRESKRARV